MPMRSTASIVTGSAGQIGEGSSSLCTERDDSLECPEDFMWYCNLGILGLSDGLSQLHELPKGYLVFVGCRGCDGDAAELSGLDEPCRKSLGAGLVGQVCI